MRNPANVWVRGNKTFGDPLLTSTAGIIELLLEGTPPNYTVANYTPTRTLDASTAILDDGLNFIATMAADFIARRTFS